MHPFQPVIDELAKAQVAIIGSENAYKLLYRLCVLKGIRVNGSPLTAAKNGGFAKKTVISQARVILREYMETGLIVLPAHMKIIGGPVKYKHDGDSTANRNTWKSGWKAPKPKNNTYGGFNTTKG